MKLCAASHSCICEAALCSQVGHLTFPIVRPRGSEQNKVVVWGETDREALLTEAKLLVSLRPALAELPFPSIQVVSLCQVLAQDVAASNGVTGL